MAHEYTPKFHNEQGVDVIKVSSSDLMCMGALPPLDHPHVYLNLGHDSEIVCPYCSTVFRRVDDLDDAICEPSDCLYPK